MYSPTRPVARSTVPGSMPGMLGAAEEQQPHAAGAVEHLHLERPAGRRADLHRLDPSLDRHLLLPARPRRSAVTPLSDGAVGTRRPGGAHSSRERGFARGLALARLEPLAPARAAASCRTGRSSRPRAGCGPTASAMRSAVRSCSSRCETRPNVRRGSSTVTSARSATTVFSASSATPWTSRRSAHSTITSGTRSPSPRSIQSSLQLVGDLVVEHEVHGPHRRSGAGCRRSAARAARPGRAGRRARARCAARSAAPRPGPGGSRSTRSSARASAR